MTCLKKYFIGFKICECTVSLWNDLLPVVFDLLCCFPILNNAMNVSILASRPNNNKRLFYWNAYSLSSFI